MPGDQAGHDSRLPLAESPPWVAGDMPAILDAVEEADLNVVLTHTGYVCHSKAPSAGATASATWGDRL
jgi:hypothetical protein